MANKNYYIKKGRTFSITDQNALDIHEILPVGTYIIQQDPFGNFIFEQTESFEFPKKVYGNVEYLAERFLNTYLDRPHTTGILLSGEKGSGKTLTAKYVSSKAAEKGIPTIIINRPWFGDAFNALLQGITQECIVIFDEFEKVYNYEAQPQLLTLLDGVFPSKKMFLFTCNEKYLIDRHMTNRPGRVFYAVDFSGLDNSFVREYCTENLKDQTKINGVLKISSMFSKFNFDMLASLVQEMNRYNETAIEAVKFLNMNADGDYGTIYNLELKDSGKVIPIENESISVNPLMLQSLEVVEDDYDEKDPDKELNPRIFRFNPTDLKSFLPDKGEFTYEQGKLVLTIKKSHVKSNRMEEVYSTMEYI